MNEYLLEKINILRLKPNSFISVHIIMNSFVNAVDIHLVKQWVFFTSEQHVVEYVSYIFFLLF